MQYNSIIQMKPSQCKSSSSSSLKMKALKFDTL
jgi:hypothetical protein